MLLFILVGLVFCKKKNLEKTKVEEPPKNYLSVKWVNYITAKLEYDRTRDLRYAQAVEANAKGFGLYKAKKDKEAIEFYEKSIDSYPLGETYYNYGNSLSNVERLDDSILAYEIALRLNPPRPELTLYNIACSYSRLNKVKESYTYLAQAIDRGYNAYEYIKKDPDMENLRKDSEWEANIEKLLNPKEYYKEDLVGKVQIQYAPRGGEDYILCASGVAISPTNPFSGQGGACPYNSAYENFQYMYSIGTWKISNGDLVIQFEKVCTPEIIPMEQEENAPPVSMCQGYAGTPIYKKCSSVSNPRRSEVTFAKRKVYSIVNSERKEEEEVFYKFEKNISEPKQCNPNFDPKTIEDLKLE